MKKFVGGHGLDEAIEDLELSEQDDFAQIGRLMQIAHAARVKHGEKSKIINKLKKLK